MPDNPGVAPLDPTTKLGQFRMSIGDTVATDVVDGIGGYSYFSDAEITQFLTLGFDSVLRAVGFAYMTWAGQAASESISIADFDLKIDYTKRAQSLTDRANFWFGQADLIDGAGTDAVQIVHTGTSAYQERIEAEFYPFYIQRDEYLL